MDWKKLKKEYIAGGTSYRKLADKYGVSFSTLRKTAAKENWRELRDKARAKSDIKIVEAISDNDARKVLSVIDAADTLLSKLIDTVEALDVIDSQSLKHYTSALKDLRDIKGVKSDADNDNGNTEVVVSFESSEGEEEWAK